MKPIEQILTDYFQDSEAVLDLRSNLQGNVIVISTGESASSHAALQHIFGDVDWLGVANAVKAKNEPVYRGESIGLADSFRPLTDAQAIADAIISGINDAAGAPDEEPSDTSVVNEFMNSFADYMRLVEGEVMTTQDDNGMFRTLTRVEKDNSAHYVYRSFSERGMLAEVVVESYERALFYITFEELPIRFINPDTVRFGQDAPIGMIHWLLSLGKVINGDETRASKAIKVYLRDGKVVYEYDGEEIQRPTVKSAWEVAQIGIREFYTTDATPVPVEAPDYDVEEIENFTPFGEPVLVSEYGQMMVDGGGWAIQSHGKEGFIDKVLLRIGDMYHVVRQTNSGYVYTPIEFHEFETAWTFLTDYTIDDPYLIPVDQSEPEFETLELPYPFGEVNPRQGYARQWVASGMWSLVKDHDEPYAGEQLLRVGSKYVVLRHDRSFGLSTVSVSGEYDSFDAAYNYFCKGLPIEVAYVAPVNVDDRGQVFREFNNNLTVTIANIGDYEYDDEDDYDDDEWEGDDD